MTPTSVGMRCPECSRDRTKVSTIRSVQVGASVTQALIAINVVAFIAQTASGSALGGGAAGTVTAKGVLDGPDIAVGHQYWRLVTSGFLHDGLLHIAFNMFFLYILGRMLEPAIGRLNFAAVYFAALLAGSFGALLLSPDIPSLGASGAAFGVLGALIAVARARRISIWQSGLGLILVINLVFSFSVANISIGGHLGGLIAGFLAGTAITELEERRRKPHAGVLVCLLIAALSVAGAIAVAGSAGLAPHGLTI
jgi:membrane associated rhomboid family serine protease